MKQTRLFDKQHVQIKNAKANPEVEQSKGFSVRDVRKELKKEASRERSRSRNAARRQKREKSVMEESKQEISSDETDTEKSSDCDLMLNEEEKGDGMKREFVRDKESQNGY